MKISIVYCTMRPEPKFKLAADSIAANLEWLKTQVELEWIIVDHLTRGANWHSRHSSIDDAVSDRFKYKHVPPKPCRWQGQTKLTTKDYPALCNARNTGLCYATGDYVIFADDCCAFGPGWLEFHVMCARLGGAGVGTYNTYKTANIKGSLLISGVPSGFKDSRDPTQLPANQGITCGQRIRSCGAWFYGINCGAPMEYILKVNGFDEAYDGQYGSDDCDFGVRIERAGCKLYHSSSARVYHILDTHDLVFEAGAAAWGSETPRKLVGGQPSNDFLIKQLLSDPHRYYPVGNWFSLYELKHKFQTIRESAFPLGNEMYWDWRDGQLLEEM